jgi:hypothetical protein
MLPSRFIVRPSSFVLRRFLRFLEFAFDYVVAAGAVARAGSAVRRRAGPAHIAHVAGTAAHIAWTA